MSTTKKEIIDYITTTPYNTNPAILSQKLDEFSANGGGSKDAVQYIPQELTEKQQMQARKNLGLYYQAWEEQVNLVYERMFVGWWETMVNEIGYIDRGDRFIVDFNGETWHCYGYDYNQFYFIGNPNLISDLSATGKVPEVGDHTAPFVIYTDSDDITTLVVDSSVSTPMGFYVKVYRPGGEVFVTKTIPEEYLPPVIVKDNNGNRYTIIVNDDGTLSAVMV